MSFLKTVVDLPGSHRALARMSWRTMSRSDSGRPDATASMKRAASLGVEVFSKGSNELSDDCRWRIDAGPEIQALMAGELTPSDAIRGGAVRIEGDPQLLDRFVATFPIPPGPDGSSRPA